MKAGRVGGRVRTRGELGPDPGFWKNLQKTHVMRNLFIVTRAAGSDNALSIDTRCLVSCKFQLFKIQTWVGNSEGMGTVFPSFRHGQSQILSEKQRGNRTKRSQKVV